MDSEQKKTCRRYGWSLLQKHNQSDINMYVDMTYVCERAQGAQETDHHQTKHKKFSSVWELIWVFIQHCSDDRLQTAKLKQDTKP